MTPNTARDLYKRDEGSMTDMSSRETPSIAEDVPSAKSGKEFKPENPFWAKNQKDKIFTSKIRTLVADVLDSKNDTWNNINETDSVEIDPSQPLDTKGFGGSMIDSPYNEVIAESTRNSTRA